MLKGNVRGLQHLGLPVTDLERSKAFYGQLGFTVAMTAELPADEGTIPVAMLALNGFVLELYQLPGVARDEIGARRDGHIDHVALDVADIERAFADARAAGLDPLEDAPVYLPFWEHGVKYFNVRGPDGEKVEFNQFLA